jgi:hypothetical protein
MSASTERVEIWAIGVNLFLRLLTFNMNRTKIHRVTGAKAAASLHNTLQGLKGQRVLAERNGRCGFPGARLGVSGRREVFLPPLRRPCP